MTNTPIDKHGKLYARVATGPREDVLALVANDDSVVFVTTYGKVIVRHDIAWLCEDIDRGVAGYKRIA